MKVDEIYCIIREVSELPDRSSPEDWPDALLVTPDELKNILSEYLIAHPGGNMVLMPLELNDEAARTRAAEQYEDCSDNFKNLHRDCGESEYSRLKARWIDNRAIQLQEQYRAMVKVVGRAK